MIQNLYNLFDVFKPSLNVIKADTRFIEMEDKPKGWTDGYIADFNHKELMQAMALIKGVTVWQSNKPKVSHLIPKGSHLVETVEFDLKSKSAVLKNSRIRTNVNPKFLGYFQKAYEAQGGITNLVLTGQLKPVKVIVGEELAGLIMPIRADR